MNHSNISGISLGLKFSFSNMVTTKNKKFKHRQRQFTELPFNLEDHPKILVDENMLIMKMMFHLHDDFSGIKIKSRINRDIKNIGKIKRWWRFKIGEELFFLLGKIVQFEWLGMHAGNGVFRRMDYATALVFIKIEGRFPKNVN